ncbi:MAG: succinate dehydrogenase iron-sulfur subunit [Phycisphaerae bacterium]
MAADQSFTLCIARQDRPGTGRYWERFEVAHLPRMNVISALQEVAAHPTTQEGKATTPVAWDCNCLEEVCGACTMLVNGRVRQSCTALIDDLLGGGATTITLEPMTKFPVMRDLVVDRRRMFQALRKVQAWVPVDGYYDAGPGRAVAPHDQEDAYPLSRCMTCGCCLEACPQYGRIEPRRRDGEDDAAFEQRREAAFEQGFLGAAAISQAVLFNMHPTGRNTAPERLDVMMQRGGISDCGNAQNCVKVCPKDIPLTRSIAVAGRQTTVHSIKQWLSS